MVGSQLPMLVLTRPRDLGNEIFPLAVFMHGLAFPSTSGPPADMITFEDFGFGDGCLGKGFWNRI